MENLRKRKVRTIKHTNGLPCANCSIKGYMMPWDVHGDKETRMRVLGADSVFFGGKRGPVVSAPITATTSSGDLSIRKIAAREEREMLDK